MSEPKNRFVELDRLESLASEALEDYNREMTLGSESVYPQWAVDLQALIKEHRVALAHNAYLEALLKKRAALAQKQGEKYDNQN